MVPATDGEFLLSGIFADTISIDNKTLISNGDYDVFLVKYNKDGKVQWLVQGGGESIEYCLLSATDKYGNIYVVGEFHSQNAFLGQIDFTLEEGDGHIVLAKLDKNGNIKWIKPKANSDGNSFSEFYSFPTGIKCDLNDNIVVKGWNGNGVYFDDILLKNHFDRPNGNFLAKFDSSGNTLWANTIHKRYSSFDFNQFDINSNNDIFIGAQIRDSIRFDTSFKYVTNGNSDLFVAKYLSNGNIEWIKTFQSGSTTDNFISSVAVGLHNNVIVSGRSNYTLSFDTIEFNSNTRNGFILSLGDSFLVINDSILSDTTISDTGDTNNGSAAFYNELSPDNPLIYPNPSNGMLQFRELPWDYFMIEIIDISGNVVYVGKISKYMNGLTLNIPSGIYTAQIYIPGKSFQQKLIIYSD